MKKAYLSDEEIISLLKDTQLSEIQLKDNVMHQAASSNSSIPWIRKRLTLVICSSTLILTFIAWTLFSPVMADMVKKLPFIQVNSGSSFEAFDAIGMDKGLLNGKQLGLSSEIDMMAEDEGVTMHIEDALYDGVRIVVGFRMEFDQIDGLDWNAVYPHYRYKGGEEYPFNAEINGDPLAMSMNGLRQNNGKSVGIFQNDYNHGSSDDFILELKVNEVTMSHYEENRRESKEVDWHFKIPIFNASELKKSVKFSQELTQKSEDFNLTVEEMTVTPVTTDITIKTTNLAGYRFKIDDEQGEFIDDSSYLSKGELKFDPINSDADFIYLTPYDKEDATDPRIYTAAVTDEFPIIVAEGTRNEVRVTDIEFLTNQTFIYFEVYGESPELLNGRISLETSSGEEIRPYIYFKAKDKSMSHKLEFPPLDEKHDYILSTTERQKLIVLDELKIKVPIPK